MGQRRAEESLPAMYFAAAVVMGVASIIVVVLMFLPPDFFSRPNAEDRWTPGTAEYVAPGDVERAPETPAEAALREELHMH